MLKERVEMKYKVITGIIFVLLLTSMLTLAFDIQQVEASGTETLPFSFSRSVSWESYIEHGSKNHTRSFGPYPLICGFNMSISDPDWITGIRNITVPKDSVYFEPVYLPPPTDNLTWRARAPRTHQLRPRPSVAGKIINTLFQLKSLDSLLIDRPSI